MSNVSVSQIDTLAQLYQTGKLGDFPAQRPKSSVATRGAQSFPNRVGLFRGDITKLEVDAIVNAANSGLLGGGGVDGAIHRAAGRSLMTACRALRGCATGSAKITDGYNLPSQKVIHAVGPIYDSEGPARSEKLLRGCYQTSLELAVSHGCKTIAFSAISTGVYGYPSQDAAQAAISTVKDFLETPGGDELDRVIFCTFVQKDVDAYNQWLPHFFPPTTDGDLHDAKQPRPADSEDDDWEPVTKGGDSAENGMEQGKASHKDATVADLPEVPTNEPGSGGPAPKKVRS